MSTRVSTAHAGRTRGRHPLSVSPQRHGDGRLVLTRRRRRGTLKPVALLVSPAVEGYAMATLTIRAIYEDGKLRPLQPLPLQEHECVLVQVLRQCTVAETSGLLPGLPLAIIREVAEGEEYSVLS